MGGQLLSLMLLISLAERAPFNLPLVLRASPLAVTTTRSRCPKVIVECPEDFSKDHLIFKAKLLDSSVPEQSLTYKWTVHGGEIKDGQGTASVTVINYDLIKMSLHATVEVGGLPKSCVNQNTCTTSV